MLELSVVIPVYDERESVAPLAARLLSVLEGWRSYEVIFVNDGSKDGSAAAIDEIVARHPHFRVIHLRRNGGKAAALQCAFDVAEGAIIVMMDADLQDLPEELPKLVRELEDKDLDAVTGWKFSRQDPISKTLPSLFFNKMVRKLSGLSIHDFNCGFKAFRRECLSGFRLYGQLHRFILIFANQHGYKVGEIAVKHAPRESGQSKFGAWRIYHGFMDLLTVFFITKFLYSPLHFFGLYGVIAILISIPLGIYYLTQHFYSIIVNGSGMLTTHPLWILSPILFTLGVIMIFFGILGEFITYNVLSPPRPGSNIREVKGFGTANSAVSTAPPTSIE